MDYRMKRGHGVSPGLYPGFRFDIKELTSPYTAEGWGWQAQFAAKFGSLLDAPLSFALDSVCNPYDIFQIGKYGKGQRKTLPSNREISRAEQILVGVEKEYVGIIRKHGWEKSGESYCQAGSEYYVLETADGRYPLNSERDPALTVGKENISSYLDSSVGQRVVIKGREVTVGYDREAEHCPPESQCLSGAGGRVSCSWIRVVEVTKVKSESR